MSIDSILQKPGIRNQQLNAAVEEYRGYVTGFGISSDLTRYASDGLKEASLDVGDHRFFEGNGDKTTPDRKEIAAQEIVGYVLNSSLGAYYLSDLLVNKNISQYENDNEIVSHKDLPPGLNYNVLGDNVKVLINPTSGNEIINKNIGTMILVNGDAAKPNIFDDDPLGKAANVRKMVGEVTKVTLDKKKDVLELGEVNKTKKPTKRDPGLGAIIIRNPKYSFATRNQSYLSVFFNAINQIDMSKSAPFISMTIYNEVPVGPNGEGSGNFLNQVAYMRFADEGDQYMKMTEYKVPSGVDQAVLRNSIRKQEANKAELLSTHMNIFTSPQTLNNGNINNTQSGFSLDGIFNPSDSFDYKSFNNVLDPLAPMLSLKSLTVNISEGGDYVVSSRQASMELVLHDRSRLADVTTFVTPGALQGAVVKIEFGWSHPDGDEHKGTTIGKFINAMREVAFYRLSSSNIRLEGSQAQITVKMDFLGGREMKQISSSDGNLISLEDDHIKKAFNAAFTFISGNYKKKSNIHKKLKIIQKSFNSIEYLIRNDENKRFRDSLNQHLAATPEAKQELFKKMLELIGLFTKDELAKNSVKQLIAKLRKRDLNKEQLGTGVRDAKLSQQRIREKLNSLMGTSRFDNVVEIIETSNNNEDENETPGFAVGDLMSQKEKQMTIAKLRGLKASDRRSYTPDYFSSINSLHYQSSQAKTMKEKGTSELDAVNVLGTLRSNNNYISLGKLIMGLVACPMTTRGLYNEIQVIFYPVNASSGGARIHTTASIPIPVKKVKEEFEKGITQGFHFTPDQSFKTISKILQDENFEIYGLSESNASLEKKLKKLYQYKKDKDGKISLSAKGKELAYSQFNSKNATSAGENVDFSTADESIKQQAYSDFIAGFKSSSVGSTLKTLYANDGLEVPGEEDSLTIVHLQMNIEVCPVIDPVKLESEGLNLYSEPYQSSASIMRLHIYDSNASPIPEFNFLSKKLLDGDRYLGYGGSAATAYEGITSKTSNGETSIVTSKAQGERPLKFSRASEMILNMSPAELKNYIKRDYPSITYGAQSAVVKSINLTSTTENEIAYGKSIQSLADQEKGIFSKFIRQTQQDLNVIPSSIDIQMIGCPFLRMGSHIYVDTGTNTDMDNVYMVHTMTHTIGPGQFQTSVKFILPFQGSTSNLRQTLAKSLMVVDDDKIQDLVDLVNDPFFDE